MRASPTRPPRGFLVPLREAADAYSWAVFAYLLATVVCAGLTVTVRHGGPAPVWVLVMGPVILAAYAAMGLVAGYRWPSLMAVPAAGLGSFCLGLLGALGVGPSVLRQGPVTGTLAGLSWDLAVFIGQAVTLLGAAAVLTCLTMPVELRRYRAVTAVALTGWLLLAGGVISLARTGDYRFETSMETTSVCEGSRPVVCVAPSNQRQLEPLARLVDALAASVAEAGVVLPSRYDQLLPRLQPDPDRGMFALPSAANNFTVSSQTAARVLTRPAPCAAWFGAMAPPTRVFEAEAVLQAWLVQKAGHTPPTINRETTAWLGEPGAEQAAWLSTTFAAFTNCDFASVKLPWA